ncbi:tRNA (adenosine(37)-N6)-threonylcarbamoyltransferase complex dimerization subunit type 1 TsaB [Altererythrobacter sp. KTW20L]|uniref:tRNA (adenosine(37)-N6)-threonylcarbamoyltransferase complex dimerization subunit type 1 TsaB n=1 Tax=Altererythrobacter sp. KTW20L TaxID=2942210 RepID=UPI0020BFA1AE|nr:tRNA (adenosine(37)-N6)-threonylcarbamoyltransferase complex dimerization subunit type 1 TsaB [Altererythrobacter sp. KTW20L]MCL6250602.1 tRNA (adenosine(37)-N6)-threonylcarbamoyltransferase complex dimerization subunit type 1 TsaB [Altererythrobacter sp. KTW20L]
MRILAIESATEACSVALFDNGSLLGHFHEVLGRGHAEHLVPAIAALPGKGRADRIVVSLGPGSFTGVRIGLAAARALGLAWTCEVLGYPTLALVATMARAAHPGEPVTVCMTGGHGEWFVQPFGPSGMPDGPWASVTPQAALASDDNRLIAGNKARELAELGDGNKVALDLLPDARHALSLPPALFTADLAPIYGRAPDAKLPGGLAA